MGHDQLVALLGETFANGENDALAPWLSVDCVYQSDYANIRMTSRAEIISRMKQVYAQIDENGKICCRGEKPDGVCT